MSGEGAKSADWHVYVTDIIECCRRIAADAEGIDPQSVTTESTLYRALLHDLAIIGEAANRLPNEVHARLQGVPWSQVIALRNRIMHGYRTIDAAIIWQTVRESVPALLAEMLTLDQALHQGDI